MEPQVSEHGGQFAAINQSGCGTFHGVAASSWTYQLTILTSTEPPKCQLTLCSFAMQFTVMLVLWIRTGLEFLPQKAPNAPMPRQFPSCSPASTTPSHVLQLWCEGLVTSEHKVFQHHVGGTGVMGVTICYYWWLQVLLLFFVTQSLLSLLLPQIWFSWWRPRKSVPLHKDLPSSSHWPEISHSADLSSTPTMD